MLQRPTTHAPTRIPTHVRARRVLRFVAPVLGCLALVTACTGSGGGPSNPSSAPPSSDTPSSSVSSSPTSSPSVSVSSSPSSTATSPPASPPATPTTTPAPVHTLTGSLLDAAEVPGFTKRYAWSQGSTGPENPSTSFGTCQRFSITSIGAERAVVRRFLPPAAKKDTDRAGELVATFPDTATARRAYSVLTAWRPRCKDRLKRYLRSDISDLMSVPVAGGTADWYLLTYGPANGDPDARYIDAQGMVLVGKRIALLAIVTASAGQDAGREPMIAALKQAAKKLT